jgi:hypothetical protein
VTTNAIDKIRLIVASDSRWSFQFDQDHLAYIDDAFFDKIAMRPGGCMICAGDAYLIQLWRNWYLAGQLDPAMQPPLNRMQDGELKHIVFHVILATGEVFDFDIQHNSIDFENEARFAGSGAVFALGCYRVNRCVKTSVTTASQDDPCTGGSMKFVELSTGINNLSSVNRTVQEVEQDLVARGHIVNTKTKEIYNFQEFASKNAAAGSKLSSGLGLSAPTGAPAFVWSEEQKKELNAAFAFVTALEQKSKTNP